MAPLVTLTTDFGTGSSYVAAMKGALLSLAPAARVVDLTHEIPPQDVDAAGRFLSETVPWFPPTTLHVVVVDPGVGTARAILCVEWQGQRLLVPDNGCWVPLTDIAPQSLVVAISSQTFWHREVAPTFHGRDVFAPVAAALCNGVPLEQVGKPVSTWVDLELPRPLVEPGRVRGQIVSVDRFGNLVSNVRPSDLTQAGLSQGEVEIAGITVTSWSTTYAHQPPGTLVALWSSSHYLEVAVVNGSAAERLGVGRGSAVEVRGSLADPSSVGKTG